MRKAQSAIISPMLNPSEPDVIVLATLTELQAKMNRARPPFKGSQLVAASPLHLGELSWFHMHCAAFSCEPGMSSLACIAESSLARGELSGLAGLRR